MGSQWGSAEAPQGAAERGRDEGMTERWRSRPPASPLHPTTDAPIHQLNYQVPCKFHLRGGGWGVTGLMLMREI